MDISKAILAKSAQLNAVDIIGDVLVTITDAKPGADDTEVLIVTDVFGPTRPYMPPKTVLREIGKVWGTQTTAWIGRQMSIYNLPSVTYGGEAKGGVRIRALSDIDKPITYTPPTADGLGKGAKVTIKPIPPRDWQSDIASAATLDALQQLWVLATAAGVTKQPEIVAAKDARKVELQEGAS